MLHKTLRVRDEMAAEHNQYDIQYADITADWQRAIEGIYSFLELPFTDQAHTAMQSWLDGNRQHQHGAHKYSLTLFGLVFWRFFLVEGAAETPQSTVVKLADIKNPS